MNHFLTTFPDSNSLLEIYPGVEILQVNSHVHTPYSFSAFTDISQIFEMARRENISLVGINDFFVTDGYEMFNREALKAGIFPLFNIEFIGLLKKEQQLNIRVNDPNNPGRCYFSGKGLNYPFSVNDRLMKKLNIIISESQDQIHAMIDKANNYFAQLNAGIILNYDDIHKNHARELVRERHVAKAIRIAVFEKYAEDTMRTALLSDIFGGKAPKSALTDYPGLENEIRNNLLKAGGKAFVEENETAFMSLDEVIEIIVNAGGIPCYPVLLDDKNGNYTEYEKDPEKLWQELMMRNIGCIELIPGRNDAGHLERFVSFFNNKGFVILLGTEHNTPEMIPLTCATHGNQPLSNTMKRISYEGACVVAAHQYLKAKGLPGFIDNLGAANNSDRDYYINLGNAVIHSFRKQFKTNQ
jgi:predicted metal-dependent phosphoesterase TrpH